MKSALITGITGQTGSYMAEFLLGKGYEVHGLVRRTSQRHFENISHIERNLHLVDADLLDETSLQYAMGECHPDEVYNFAAQSFVGLSVSQPIYTAEVTGLGVLRILEALRYRNPYAKFYQASSSEMFGAAVETPQNENTPFNPRSPYGAAKVFGHHIVKHYREEWDMFACSGIGFNHESPRRGIEFVTKKVVDAAVRIFKGEQKTLELGSLEPLRDWGYAGEYVEAMWLMLQQDTPEDFVIGTGETHSVGEFVEEAFRAIGLNEWEKYVVQNPKYIRKREVDLLRADATKAKNILNWEAKIKFKELVNLMVGEELLNQGGTKAWRK